MALVSERGWNGVRPFESLPVAIRGLENPVRRMREFEKMAQRDPVVSALLLAIEMQVRGSTWSVESCWEPDLDDDDSGEMDDVDGGGMEVSSEQQAADDAAVFIDSCLHDMNVSFEEFLSSAMSMTTYGFSLFEMVYKLRDGEDGDVLSKFDDRMLGLRKLAPRPQRTINRWIIDDHGGINGAMQYAQRGVVVWRCSARRTRRSRLGDTAC